MAVRISGMNTSLFQWRSLKTRVTLFTLLIFVVSLWLLTLFSGRLLQRDMQQSLGEQQLASVTLLAREVNGNLSDRLQALEAIASQVTPALLANPAALQTMLEQRPLLQLLFNGGVFITGRDGTAIADVPLAAGRTGINYMDRMSVSVPLTEGKTVIGRPIIGKKLGVPVFSITAPIRNTQGQVIGALVGSINLGWPNFLDKITQSAYGKTGGYLLIAPQHKLIVTATDKSRIMQPLPGPGINAMLDQFMQGYEGFGVAVNSRGVLELSAAAKVPVAGWFLVATLPTHEAFAPIDHLLQRLLQGTVLVTVLAGILTWWLMTRMLRQQFAPMLAASRTLASLAASNQPVQALPVTSQDEIGELIASFNRLLDTLGQRESALRESEDRWKFAIEGIGDGLWDWQVQTGVVFYSRRYKEMLGFTDDEIGQSNDEWRKRLHPDDAPGVMAALLPCLKGQTGPVTLEYRMLGKDGHWQWILGRGLVVSRDSAGRSLRMIGTHTDITERKQTEAIDQFLSGIGSDTEAEPFFPALARFLAHNLQMDYICIDRLERDTLRATTLAVWYNGHFEDNETYALHDTPCGTVVGQAVCCYPAGVSRLFPNDPALVKLQAESYVGVTLWSHSGQPIGLIAAIGHQPLAHQVHAETTLARVAVRAAGELERLNAEAAMRESEARFRTVVEVIPDAIALHSGGKLLFVNPAAVAMFAAKTPADLIGRPILDFIHPDFQTIALMRLKEAMLHGIAAPRMEERFIRLDGSVFDAEVQGQPIVLAGIPALLSILRDITQRKQAEAKLQLAASVFDHALEGIMITDPDGSIIDVNAAFTRITGYARDEALGQNPRLLSSGQHDPSYFEAMWQGLIEQGYWYGEIWNRRKNGDLFAEMQAISAVRDAAGQVRHYVSLFSDITALKAHESQLEHIAHFDALTNLPNRLMLADRLHQGMAQTTRRDQTLALAFLDLDGFKCINDSHGHDVGDQLLIALAARMKQALREGDTLARVGGDEFVAVLTDLSEGPACTQLLARLLAAAAQPVVLGALAVQVSASLGVTFYPQAADVDADQLLRQADFAMYQAKIAGKNRYQIFEAAPPHTHPFAGGL